MGRKRTAIPGKKVKGFARKKREEKRTMKLTQRAQVEGCVSKKNEVK